MLLNESISPNSAYPKPKTWPFDCLVLQDRPLHIFDNGVYGNKVNLVPKKTTVRKPTHSLLL